MKVFSANQICDEEFTHTLQPIKQFYSGETQLTNSKFEIQKFAEFSFITLKHE